MRRVSLRVLGLAVIFTAVLLIGNVGPTARAGKQEPKLPQPQPVEKSMHEFMEYYFEPSYLRLKATMASKEKEKDKKFWVSLKAESLVLAEGTNLLLTRLPDKDEKAWANFAFAVREAGTQLYQAARKKDEAVALSAYKTMLTKCNACHKQFDKNNHQLQP